MIYVFVWWLAIPHGEIEDLEQYITCITLF